MCVHVLDITRFVRYGKICMRGANMHVQFHKWKRLRLWWKINMACIFANQINRFVCICTNIRMFRHIEMHKCNTNWLTYSDPEWAKNLHATMYYMHGKKMNKISGFELEKEKQEKFSIGSASKTSKIDSKIKWIGQQSNHWNGIAIKVNCVYALYFSLSFFFLPLSLAS